MTEQNRAPLKFSDAWDFCKRSPLYWSQGLLSPLTILFLLKVIGLGRGLLPFLLFSVILAVLLLTLLISTICRKLLKVERPPWQVFVVALKVHLLFFLVLFPLALIWAAIAVHSAGGPGLHAMSPPPGPLLFFRAVVLTTITLLMIAASISVARGSATHFRRLFDFIKQNSTLSFEVLAINLGLNVWTYLQSAGPVTVDPGASAPVEALFSQPLILLPSYACAFALPLLYARLMDAALKMEPH